MRAVEPSLPDLLCGAGAGLEGCGAVFDALVVNAGYRGGVFADGGLDSQGYPPLPVAASG